MPIDYEWDPKNTEDSVETLKRLERLQHGLLRDLWKMSKNCHKEVFEKGNEEHLPMVYIRHEESGELFYICRKCLSDYIMKHPINRKKIEILRGRLTEEAEEYLRSEAAKQIAKEAKEYERKYWSSNEPCPVCGRPRNKHNEQEIDKCYRNSFKKLKTK